MENLILIIVLYVIGSLISDKANEKKRKKRKAERIPAPTDTKLPPYDNPFDFDIPKIEGAPKDEPEPSLDLDEVYKEEPKDNPYLKYLNTAEEKEKRSKESKDTSIKSASIERKTFAISKDKVREGIILAEILGKPKALKGRRRI
ncbi:MAG: hypothetical protein J6O04_08600 [Selenomonadaceae bacterium]|nr:hypothetical protein [Selenomonadaceae bacterium]